MIQIRKIERKFDDMRMVEGENIFQYVARFKEVVSAIRGIDGKISDETIIRKAQRTLLHILLECFNTRNDMYSW